MKACRAFSDAGKLVASLLHDFDWFSSLCLCVFVNFSTRPARIPCLVRRNVVLENQQIRVPLLQESFTEFSMRVMRFDHVTFLHFRFNFLAFEEEDVDDGVGFDGNEQDI
jgi:hypothetical protein